MNGKCLQRAKHASAYKMDWHERGTGNVLLEEGDLEKIGKAFRSEFGTGSEDVNLFRRIVGKRVRARLAWEGNCL